MGETQINPYLALCLMLNHTKTRANTCTHTHGRGRIYTQTHLHADKHKHTYTHKHACFDKDVLNCGFWTLGMFLTSQLFKNEPPLRTFWRRTKWEGVRNLHKKRHFLISKLIDTCSMKKYYIPALFRAPEVAKTFAIRWISKQDWESGSFKVCQSFIFQLWRVF